LQSQGISYLNLVRTTLSKTMHCYILKTFNIFALEKTFQPKKKDLSFMRFYFLIPLQSKLKTSIKRKCHFQLYFWGHPNYGWFILKDDLTQSLIGCLFSRLSLNVEDRSHIKTVIFYYLHLTSNEDEHFDLSLTYVKIYEQSLVSFHLRLSQTS